MEQARTKVRALILAITGGIIALLVLRFILVFLGADPNHFLVDLVLDVSYVFEYPFISFTQTGLFSSVDANAVIAILIYAVLGILVSELITAFLQDDPVQIMVELIDSIFKVIEFLLISRIVLKLFGIAPEAGIFVAQAYNVTNWSQGILPARDFLAGQLDISAIIVLVIVIFVDLVTEGVISALRKRIGERMEKTKAAKAAKPAEPKSEPKAEAPAHTPAQAPVVVNVPAVPAPAPQSITINVPVPVVPQPISQEQSEKQVINVQPVPSVVISPPTAQVSPAPMQTADRLIEREG